MLTVQVFMLAICISSLLGGLLHQVAQKIYLFLYNLCRMGESAKKLLDMIVVHCSFVINAGDGFTATRYSC